MILHWLFGGILGFLAHAWPGILLGACIGAYGYFLAPITDKFKDIAIGVMIVLASIWIGSLYARIDAASAESRVAIQNYQIAKANEAVCLSANRAYANQIMAQNDAIDTWRKQVQADDLAAQKRAETVQRSAEKERATIINSPNHGPDAMNAAMGEYR